MPIITRHEHEKRVNETIRALADLGTTEGARVMRERYSWSPATWARYRARAAELMSENQLCADDERMRLIESLEAAKRDPHCTPNARIRADEMIARIRGAFAPVQVDARTLNVDVELNARVQRMLDSFEAQARITAANAVALPSVQSAP